MPVGHHYALVLELRPMDELYTCCPCECYWVNELLCFVCNSPGSLVVKKLDNGNTEQHRRFTQQALDFDDSDIRLVSPSIRFVP